MDFEPARINMNADATRSGAVVAVGQSVDEGFPHGGFGIERGVLAFRAALDEAGDGGCVADDEGICVLEDGVQWAFERLHVAVGVACLVGVVAHGADANLRQSKGRIAGEQDIP